MKIAYFYTEGRKARLTDKKEGIEIPYEFFLGAIQLKELGFDIDLYEISDFAKPGKKPSGSIFSLYNYCSISSSKQLIDKVMIRVLNNYDLIVASNEYIAFGLLDFYQKKILTPPFIFFAMGMLSQIEIIQKHTLKNLIKRKIGRYLYQKILSRVSTTIFLGIGEYHLAKKQYSKFSNKLKFLSFPVDTKFWKPADESSFDHDYILFIGNDNRRDYELLLKITDAMPNTNFVIISQRVNEKKVTKNVKIIKGDWRERVLTDNKIREYINNSKLVILPLKYTFQPSGQSVAQQSMACKKTVLITETPGFWDINNIKNKVHLISISSENYLDWTNLITEFSDRKAYCENIGENARELMINQFSLKAFALKLKEIIEGLP